MAQIGHAHITFIFIHPWSGLYYRRYLPPNDVAHDPAKNILSRVTLSLEVSAFVVTSITTILAQAVLLTRKKHQ